MRLLTQILLLLDVRLAGYDLLTCFQESTPVDTYSIGPFVSTLFFLMLYSLPFLDTV